MRTLSTCTRGLKYVSKYRVERIRAIADYICLPKHLHENATGAAQNGLSLDRAGLTDTWRSEATTSSNSNDSNITDDEGAPLNKAQRTSRTSKNNGTARPEHVQNDSRWDVVCLQELWCSEDWEYLQERVKSSGSGLIHGRYFWR